MFKEINNPKYQLNDLSAPQSQHFWRHCVLALLLLLLADRTNGRTIGTMLRASVVVCTECIVAKRWVLEQNLLLRSYRKSYMINRLVLKWMTLTRIRLEVVSRSCQPLRYIWLWISRKPLEIEAWFQRTTNRKWHMGYQMVTWPMTLQDPRRCCEAVWSAVLVTAWLHVNIIIPKWDKCTLIGNIHELR